MNDSGMIHRTLTLTATVLFLAAATSVGAVQNGQPPQDDNKDPRYYVHVSGIT